MRSSASSRTPARASPASWRIRAASAIISPPRRWPGALPAQNSPQRCPYGLYAEQLSGTAFTAPRTANRRSWLYRIRPAVAHRPFQPIAQGRISSDFSEPCTPPEPAALGPAADARRRRPISSMASSTLGGNGDPRAQTGCAIHLYAANRSMRQRAFYDADGELLIVPQQGRLLLTTELGRLARRAARDRRDSARRALSRRAARRRARAATSARTSARAFRLPDLGPIGSNGLACERDFMTPVAWYEDRESRTNWSRSSWAGCGRAPMDHSPFDVVAWRGNYAPYKYDLRRFNTIGSISYRPSGSFDLPGAAVDHRYRRASTASTS